MTDNSNNKFVKKLLIVFGIFSVGILLLLLSWKVLNLLLLLFASVLFACFLLGLGRKLAAITPIPEKVAVWIMIILVFGVIVGVNYFVGDQIAAEFSKLSQSLQNALQDLKSGLKDTAIWSRISDRVPSISEVLKPKGSYVQKAFGVFSTTLGILADLLVFIALSLFIASSPALYVKGILMLFPDKQAGHVNNILDKLSKTLFHWLGGRLLDMLALGILTGLGLWIIGVPLPITLGILTAILSFIPNIGPFLAVIPPSLLAYSVEPHKVYFVWLLFVIIQLLESYLLTPFIQKKAVSIAPVFLLMSQLIMAYIAGFFGLLLATPVAAVLLVLIKELYVKDILGKKIQ